MYRDYPISRELFHWELQSNTSQASPTGQNLIRHRERRYTILLFAQYVKSCTRPGVDVWTIGEVAHRGGRG